MKLFLKVLVLFCTCITLLERSHAADPVWWTESETQIMDAAKASDDFSAVAQGQLLHVASMARIYLESQGPVMSDTRLDFSAATNHYYAVNLGQLKNLGDVFYDHLALHFPAYDAKANLIARGYPASWAYGTPWYPTGTPEAALVDNYALANLGQLKMVFSFDFSFLNLDPTGDYDGDGVTNEVDVNSFNDLVGGLNVSITFPADGAQLN